ncbi:NAD(P)/FAD-dependent oxidoreductase [soil metagenome]
MSATPTGEQLSDLTLRWLTEFESALAAKDGVLLDELFVEESYWRDVVSFTWDLRQLVGREGIKDTLLTVVDDIAPHDFRLSATFPAPAITPNPGLDYIEAYIDFNTAQGVGSGFVRLNIDESAPTGTRAWALYTRLETLNGYEPATQRPHAYGVHGKGGQANWLDQRTKLQEFEDRDPVVLIAGGGHSGIMAAVALEKLGVEALVVDKNERVGDNWRKRYYSLALHNPTIMSTMPDMPFPESFPEYLPKDKLANWLEAYVDAKDVNFWTSTEFLGGTYDEDRGEWTVKVRRGDGTERTMHPKHVIMATGGVGGTPRVPKLKGIDAFEGHVTHSSHFGESSEFAGKKALVVGMGTSAHDLAFNLYNNGADVTMLQRSATSIVQLDTANMAYATYTDGTPLAQADVKAGADYIYPILVAGLGAYTQATEEIDKDLHEKLRAVGMKLDIGEDDTGWLMKFLRYGGGYYLNVGASDVIIAGGIKLIQASDVDTFVKDGALLTDGTTLDFDVIVLATGFENQQTEVARYFGDELADKVGEIAGFAEDGEVRNSWRPTSQEGLWICIGGFQQNRIYSTGLAIQIKARLDDLMPKGLPLARTALESVLS